MNRAPLFQLGHVVATSNALRTIEEALGEATPAYLAALINRHARGDWGDIHPDDVGLNEAALEHGNRILKRVQGWRIDCMDNHGSGSERDYRPPARRLLTPNLQAH